MSYATCPACRRSFVQDEPWKLLCLRCYMTQKSRERRPEPAAPTGPVIGPDMLRLLLQLCHPDRHGNSAASTRATQFLLALRTAHREAQHV